MRNPELTRTSLEEFHENIQYARALITSGVALQEIQNLPAHPEDLYRAAWNQAVSAMDHWMHDEIIERAVRLANDTGNQRPQRMRDLLVPFEMVERMAVEPRYVVFRDFLEQEFGRASFHGVDDITKGIRLVSDITRDVVWGTIGRAHGMSRQQAERRHNEVIKRRNDISHRADRDANGQRQPMTDAQASAAVDWIHGLVQVLSGLLG